MTISKLQSALLDWFWNDQEDLKSLQVIDNRCVSIFKQFYPGQEPKYAKYKIFYPLLRMGVVEFYGNDKYALSPTSVLFSQRFILATNLPNSIKEIVNTLSPKVVEFLGLSLYVKSTPLLHYLKENNIPCHPFCFENLLNKLPSLESIIESWEEDFVTSHDKFLLFKDKWVNSFGHEGAGVFKKSNLPYAQRTCRLWSGIWKTVPELKQNPDGFNVAVLWSKTQDPRTLKAVYNPEKSTILISESIFPFILERLLILNTLLNHSQGNNILNRQYYLTDMQYRMLTHFFGNSII